MKINDSLGLHPNLKELKEQIYDRGELAIIQGTSYPNPTRSHFESMEIWHAGSPEDAADDGFGWLGKALDST